jgi:hypothetical protein
VRELGDAIIERVKGKVWQVGTMLIDFNSRVSSYRSHGNSNDGDNQDPHEKHTSLPITAME